MTSSPGLPAMAVPAIARFDNWDPRECAVGNPAEWQEAARTYTARLSSENQLQIPRILHQIWIGPKEAPCVWLDTFRVGFMGKYGRRDGWDYRVWDDAAAAELAMANQDLYDVERMWQCKADILRLEILYQHGGLYVDSDVVYTGKNLDDILEMGRETGFVITYEPDTKDKPYSVLGNSIFAATPRHPIVAMLIQYIRTIYHHKRPYHGVEWVTGPLAYTKCLVHTEMPMSVPESHLFYPKFHYVPNPSAIDISQFPDAYAFQFGYTCSGLGNWVAENNRCIRAAECSYHSKKTDWPFGGLLSLGTASPGSDVVVPKVVHQFVFQKNPSAGPHRWMATWRDNFVSSHPGWSYKLWTLGDLKKESKEWFFANVYRDDKPMDEEALSMLAAELLYKKGGVYVPLSTIWSGNAGDDSLWAEVTEKSFVRSKKTGILASAPSNVDTLEYLSELYDGTDNGSSCAGIHNAEGVTVLGHPDSIAAYTEFPQWTRFLAVEAVYDMTLAKSSQGTILSWGYDGQVPVFRVDSDFNSILCQTGQRSLIVTEPKFGRFRSLRDALPGLIATVDENHPEWDMLIVSVEFCTGENRKHSYKVQSTQFSSESIQMGVVLNFNRSKDKLPRIEKPADLVSAVAKMHTSAEVYCVVEQFAGTKELAEIYSSMDSIKHAFQRLAGHKAPMSFSSTEVHGRLLKGFQGENQLCLEIAADDEGRIMYRSWNDDGGMNCECKLVRSDSSETVEWMRVYFNHQTVFEATNKSL
eukprot:CAMPEP_0198332592 /NCGR_PEP_ID=MMETSP1450-20131203/18388_1 /TAXON_ID=753684 ORGANISM="Madagascaria erythrocladiodes, Strain CCMP3234" /NCGR_SAMPLE_ID=MMETSP1450 /ASSEMBLY_ACC=CAM_ASM_001115 /LENGTH=752 /DNA_ID=CAMNT_0044037053 /DNA_START=77 /DNA_END=2335 /DNA_ORIENTATION=-